MSITNVAFLLSAPYSGATLFSILMNQHPKISCDAEMFPYERGSKITCGCGKPQIDCEYYSTVASSMIRYDKNEYDSNVFYYVPKYCKNHYLSRFFEGFWLNGFNHKLRNYISTIPRFREIEGAFIKRHMELFSKSLKLRNASLYFDGSKSIRRAEFFAERKISSKMVYLIRDGRAFCNSFIKNKKLSKNKLHVAAKFWRKSIKKVDILQERFPNLKILVVRYHDLCVAPEQELKRVWTFLELDFDQNFLKYEKKDMHMLGNRMLFEYTGIIREDILWEKQLKKEEILLLNKLMEKELIRFNFI